MEHMGIITGLGMMSQRLSGLSFLVEARYYSPRGCNKMHPVAGRTKALWISRQICFVEWPKPFLMCFQWRLCCIRHGHFYSTTSMFVLDYSPCLWSPCEPSIAKQQDRHVSRHGRVDVGYVPLICALDESQMKRFFDKARALADEMEQTCHISKRDQLM